MLMGNINRSRRYFEKAGGSASSPSQSRLKKSPRSRVLANSMSRQGSSLKGSQKPHDELHGAILRGEISYSDLEGIIRRFK